jgi:ArsR family transcriptional regulator
VTIVAEPGWMPEGLADADVASLAKALGHPARVRIVRLLLRRRTCSCGELVEQLPFAQSTVSEHLKVLKHAGLIVGEIDGPRTCYCVDRARLALLHELVGGMLSDAAEPVVDGGCACR